MLMMRLAFPELDWEIGVRTRATLMLFDLQLNTRKVQQLNASRHCRTVFHTRKSISRLSSTQEMFSYNVPLMTLHVKTIHKLKNRFM